MPKLIGQKCITECYTTVGVFTNQIILQLHLNALRRNCSSVHATI